MSGRGRPVVFCTLVCHSNTWGRRCGENARTDPDRGGQPDPAGSAGRLRFRVDGDGTIGAVSDGLLSATGRAREELVGQRLSALLAPGDDERYEVAVGRAARAAVPAVEVAVGIATADGGPRRYQLEVVALGDEPGEWDSVATGRAVASAEPASERANRRAGSTRGVADGDDPPYAAIVENLRDAVVVVDESRRLTYVNESALASTDCGPGDVIGTHLDALLAAFVPNEGNREMAREAVRELLEGGRKRARCEVEVETGPLGESVSEFDLAAFEGADGRRRVLGIGRTVTERVERAAALRRERDLTERLLQTAPTGILLVASDREILRANERVATLFGATAEELVGTRAGEGDCRFLDAEGSPLPPAARPIERVLEHGESVLGFECQVAKPDGDRRWVRLNAEPVRGPDGDFDRVVVACSDVTERREREQTLTDQNERLERLNRINAVIRDVDQALVSATTRAEIEEAVCDRLAAADAYRFAWIGRERHADGTIEPRAAAGPFEEYLEEITVRTDETPLGQGPAGRAHRERESQVVEDVAVDPTFEPYRATASEYGFRSVASIPIVYEDTLYGVLTVYADEERAFGEVERAVLEELGETIGHAISGLQAKQALMTERVTEVTVQLHGDGSFVAGLSTAVGGPVTVEAAVFQADESFLHYATAADADADAVRAVADADPDVEHCRIVTDHEDACALAFALSAPGLYQTVSDHGGRVQSFEATDGAATATVELPASSDTYEVLEALRRRFADVSLLAQREAERSVQTRQQFRETLTDRLSERQHAALEIAYYAGYFDWPRESTGEEVAASMDVTPPTFHKHLRLAERKLVATVLADAGADRG
ncbi:MAG: bacterio-opsin activator domain-containing protein [Haloarculaceae archaeon]